MEAIQDDAELPEGSTVGMSLPNDATAPREARYAVRATLTRWRLPALIESCVLTVSELVTNAVRYGLPPLSLVMRRRKGAVRIDVNDARPEPLEEMGRTQPDRFAESGRGLAIVREVADDLGSEHIPGDGKKVYASWNVATDQTAQNRQSPSAAEPASRTRGFHMLQDEIEPFVRWSGLIGQALLDAQHIYPGWDATLAAAGITSIGVPGASDLTPEQQRGQNMLSTLIMEQTERRVADEVPD